MKWYVYVICVVLIIASVFCGINLYKEIKAESYINGQIDITNRFSQESFCYSATNLVFNLDTYADVPDTYVFEQSLLKVDDFNAEKKNYQVKLNNYILFDVQINAGSVFANTHIDFYDTNGELTQGADMKISILFLSDKTQLKFVVVGQESRAFMEKYFADNGIRLQVIEIIEEGVKA